MKTPISQRGLAVAAGLAVASTAAVAEPFLYVPTVDGPGQIEVVDVATDKVVARLEGFPAAHGMAGTPDGRYLVVGSLEERAADAMADRPAGVSAEDHAAHHGGGEDAMAGTSTLTILDGETGQPVRRIDLPGGVHHVATSPDGRFAAATHPGTGGVSVVSLESFATLALVQAGPNPNYAAFTPDGTMLAISAAGADRIVLVDTATWETARTIPVGRAPEHLVLSPAGNQLFVNNTGEGSVSIVDLAAGEVLATYQLGGMLHGIDVTDDGGALIVSVREHDKIARLDIESGSIATADLAPAPYHVTTAPGSGKAYVSSAEQPGLTVIDQGDLSVLGQIETRGTGHQMVNASTIPASAGEGQ